MSIAVVNYPQDREVPDKRGGTCMRLSHVMSDYDCYGEIQNHNTLIYTYTCTCIRTHLQKKTYRLRSSSSNWLQKLAEHRTVITMRIRPDACQPAPARYYYYSIAPIGMLRLGWPERKRGMGIATTRRLWTGYGYEINNNRELHINDKDSDRQSSLVIGI